MARFPKVAGPLRKPICRTFRRAAVQGATVPFVAAAHPFGPATDDIRTDPCTARCTTTATARVFRGGLLKELVSVTKPRA